MYRKIRCDNYYNTFLEKFFEKEVRADGMQRLVRRQGSTAQHATAGSAHILSPRPLCHVAYKQQLLGPIIICICMYAILFFYEDYILLFCLGVNSVVN